MSQDPSNMEQLIAQAKKLESGRRMLIRLYIAILLITIWVVVWYQTSLDSFDMQMFLQQAFRLALLVVLMFFTWRGKLWAKILLALLLLIGALAAMIGLVDNPGDWSPKAPLIALAFIYGFSFYYLIFSKNFNLFFNSIQKGRNK